jgi:hypothetical protein
MFTGNIKLSDELMKTHIDWNKFKIILQYELTKEWKKLLQKRHNELVKGDSKIKNPKGLLNG